MPPRASSGVLSIGLIPRIVLKETLRMHHVTFPVHYRRARSPIERSSKWNKDSRAFASSSLEVCLETTFYGRRSYREKRRRAAGKISLRKTKPAGSVRTRSRSRNAESVSSTRAQIYFSQSVRLTQNTLEYHANY